MLAAVAVPADATGRRIGAAFIDLAVYSVLSLALFFALAEKVQAGLLPGTNAHVTLGDSTWLIEGGDAVRYYLLCLLLGVAYFGLLPGLSSWTPGKLITRVRVVRPDGRRAGLGRHLLRPLLWVVDGFPYFLPGLVGFVMVLARSDCRRVADLAADTYVVRREDIGLPVAPGGAASPQAQAGAGPAAGWYPDPQAQSGLRWWDGGRWTDHTQTG
jgi:uncharacterized RDD family membrane protein YckC